jgi:hypothetical protein
MGLSDTTRTLTWLFSRSLFSATRYLPPSTTETKGLHLSYVADSLVSSLVGKLHDIPRPLINARQCLTCPVWVAYV